MIKIIGLVLLVAIALTACKSRDKETTVKTLTINLQEGDPPSLNPYVGIDLRSRNLFLSLFEPLMRRTPQGNLEPAAASNVEIDSSQTVYLFHLRPHKWSNGEEVTSYQFADSWKYALKPDSHCFRADLFYPIKNAEKVKKGELTEESLGISTPDEHTLIVTLEHPTPYFLDLTATSFFCPVYHASDEEPDTFNGPFVVKEWVPDQKLVFKRNPHYWDADAMQLQEICFTMIKDPMTAYAMFEKGELDLVGDPLSPLPFDMIPTLAKSENLQCKMISRIFYLLLNTEIAPLDSKPLRKALALSIDRDELTQHLFFGEIPTIVPLPITLSSLKGPESKVEEKSCKELFEEALVEMKLTRETLPKIVFSYAELSGQKKLAEFIQEQWKKKLGIDIEIVCNEWNVHIANLRKGAYQIGTLHLTTLYQDPMFYFELFRDKNARCNYCRWDSESFRKLLVDSENTIDANVRKLCLKQAEQQLLEEMPVISLFTQNLQYLIRDNLSLEISDLGIYDFKHFRQKSSLEKKTAG